MIASHVAQVGDLLRNRVKNYHPLPEPKPIASRDQWAATAVVVGIVLFATLWGTGILLSLIAKLFM